MSRQLLAGHHERHYGGDVERLNALRARLATLPADAPGYLTAALKREELRALNSTVLHELYFEGLGGGAGPDRALAGLIEGAFGSLTRWRQDFTTTAMSLAGGQGWVMLAYLPERGQLLNAWMHDSLVATAGATPLIVLDMYEHAYNEDFGRDARAYVEAFHDSIDWQAVAMRAGTTHGADVSS
jgi:Fe-Mn family superoxide dismutase